MAEYDVVVVGGGPAGLSAALVLSRARRRVLVVDSGAPRNAPAAHMHGFLSRDGTSPAELLRLGREEVTGYGGEFVEGTVTEASREGSGFRLRLAGGNEIGARRLVVTTGLRDVLPDIAGLWERWARDVLHCPYCHGYEVRDQRLGVVGHSVRAAHYAETVRQWSDDVVFFTPPGALPTVPRARLAARGIGLVEGTIAAVVVENDRLVGVEVDGQVVRRDALFVPPRLVPNSDLLVELGCEVDEAGWPAHDNAGRTSVPGVWVAGNVGNPKAQVITAAGEGSTTAIAVNADLVHDDAHAAVRDYFASTPRP